MNLQQFEAFTKEICENSHMAVPEVFEALEDGHHLAHFPSGIVLEVNEDEEFSIYSSIKASKPEWATIYADEIAEELRVAEGCYGNPLAQAKARAVSLLFLKNTKKVQDDGVTIEVPVTIISKASLEAWLEQQGLSLVIEDIESPIASIPLKIKGQLA